MWRDQPLAGPTRRPAATNIAAMHVTTRTFPTRTEPRSGSNHAKGSSSGVLLGSSAPQAPHALGNRRMRQEHEVEVQDAAGSQGLTQGDCTEREPHEPGHRATPPTVHYAAPRFDQRSLHRHSAIIVARHRCRTREPTAHPLRFLARPRASSCRGIRGPGGPARRRPRGARA